MTMGEENEIVQKPGSSGMSEKSPIPAKKSFERTS